MYARQRSRLKAVPSATPRKRPLWKSKGLGGGGLQMDRVAQMWASKGGANGDVGDKGDVRGGLKDE